MKNRFILFLTMPGVLMILFSLYHDMFWAGKNGIGPAQFVLIDFGAALALLGVGLTLSKREPSQPAVPTRWLDQISNAPNIAWIMAGAFIVFLIFVIFPMFFDPIHRLVYFNKYLPALEPIGWDIVTTLDSIRTWLTEGVAKVYYPPLTTILLAPLLLFVYPLNYYIITVITLISFFLFGFLMPFLIVGRGDRSVILFVFVISAFSYGLQFELGSGQFHTIAMLFCISAIYLFHKRPQYRFFAYILFCISIQLKIYPALFFVLFVDDWRAWMINIKRFVTLGLVNFLLLFLLGYSYFSKFIAHIMASSTGSTESWTGNHSITSFLNYLTAPKTRLLDANSLAWLSRNINLLTYLFLAYFIICFIIIWVNTCRHNIRGIDSFLVMACVIGGLIIPSINQDYTLPLLTAPFALMASEQYSSDVPYKRVMIIILLIISSFTYTLTLLPYLHKPQYLKNNFPLLIILLTTTMLFSFLRKKEDAV